MQTRILESGRKARLREEQEKVRCPECNSTSHFGSLGVKTIGEPEPLVTKRKLRCLDCSCLFEVFLRNN